MPQSGPRTRTLQTGRGRNDGRFLEVRDLEQKQVVKFTSITHAGLLFEDLGNESGGEHESNRAHTLGVTFSWISEYSLIPRIIYYIH